MKNLSKNVSIFGAGLSGLVAGIQLKEQGYNVTIFDRYHRLGGNPSWHPSIQTTVLNLPKTSEYIGIDLKSCFTKVNEIRFYRYGSKKIFALDNMYVCERGPREHSLDNFLFKKAVSSGVKFIFNEKLNLSAIQKHENTIISSGLLGDVYEELNIPYTKLFGYRAVLKKEFDSVLISYMLKCTNYDFAYLASKNGLLFALLFSRNLISKENLVEFQDILKQTEGLEFKKWIHSSGALPKNKRLFHEGLILAGSICGMIDPFVLHGISGALTSGRVAAYAITDREKAISDFNWLSKNYSRKKILKAISMRLPFKNISLPVMMYLDAQLRGVGFVN